MATEHSSVATYPKLSPLHWGYLRLGCHLELFTALLSASCCIVTVNMSPGLFKPHTPRQQQILSRKLVHDLLSLEGLAPGGLLHPFTNPEVAALRFHPDAVMLGQPECGGGCSTAADCNSKPACVLCRVCRNSLAE